MQAAKNRILITGTIFVSQLLKHNWAYTGHRDIILTLSKTQQLTNSKLLKVLLFYLLRIFLTLKDELKRIFKL